MGAAGMGHGNASDLVFFAMLAGVIQSIFFSHWLFEDLGPLKATFRNDMHQVEVEALSKFGGGLCLIIGASFRLVFLRECCCDLHGWPTHICVPVQSSDT